MAKRTQILTKDFLYNEYVVLGKSIQEIHDEFHINQVTISKAMNRFGIAKRTHGSRKGKVNKAIYKKKNDIDVGYTSGNLTVVEYVKGGCLCRCVCGNTVIIKSSRFRQYNRQYCTALCPLRKSGEQHHLFKGFSHVSKSLYKHYYKHAVDRNLTFDVSIEELSNLFDNQNGLCALSQRPITMKKSGNDKLGTASLDRIDSSQPYSIKNVQWLHKDVNKMKWDLPQDLFIDWCKAIAAQHR